MRIRYLNLKLSLFLFLFFKVLFLVLSKQLLKREAESNAFLKIKKLLKSLGFCFASLFVLDFVVV